MNTAKIIAGYAHAVDNLQILNENLMKHLEQCADELESEINNRYGNTQNIFPSEKRKYDNDMKTVIDARLWIDRSKKENGVPGYDD